MKISLILFGALLLSISHETYQSDEIRVMTFNIWLSGNSVENGQQKIAKHILMVNPDVVALQEVYTNVTQNITRMLGPQWRSIEHPNTTYPDTAILTRHVFLPNTLTYSSCGVGVAIFLRTGHIFRFWDLHLDYSSYGPYAANNKMVDSINQIMVGEQLGRGPQILEVLNEPTMKNWIAESDDYPLIVAGDFNGPSHLDWTEETRKIHGDWVVRWPATKELQDNGFTDSYREIYPNITTNPGHTWSTVNKFNPEWNYTIPEPQDRIDFIFYKGPVAPFQSITYSGYEIPNRIPFHRNNDYPSDHFAVYTDFQFM